MELTFSQLNQRNPCFACPAPCCRMQLIPHKTPTTFMDMDFLRYMLLFPGTEVVVTTSGEWKIIRWQDCSALEAETITCRMHNTSAKPRTCAMYNPYNCWYKRSFVTDGSAEVYRMDLARFEVWVHEIQFGEDGQITSVPNFERSLKVLKDMPMEPSFHRTRGETLRSDPRAIAVG